MAKEIVLDEDVEMTLTVIYVIGFIGSIWLILLSPMLIEWMGAKLIKHPKGRRNWGKIYLTIVLFQPITFIVCAIGLWWASILAVLPPIHFFLSMLALIAIDFFRVEEPWEREHERMLRGY